MIATWNTAQPPISIPKRNETSVKQSGTTRLIAGIVTTKIGKSFLKILLDKEFPQQTFSCIAYSTKLW